ncbi:MAG: hypothetical protein GY801_01620 [bacterium]|nr:hypothetical protein [bacterium]
MRFVLDTIILVKASTVKSLDCLKLMMTFYNNDQLAIGLDYEGVIDKEYRQLNDNETYQKWKTAMFEGNQIHYVSGKIEQRIQQELQKRGFHEPTDQTFVAVALHSDGNIVSEDSDYGKGDDERSNTPEKQEVLRYMVQDLKLNVMDSVEALEFISTRLS